MRKLSVISLIFLFHLSAFFLFQSSQEEKRKLVVKEYRPPKPSIKKTIEKKIVKKEKTSKKNTPKKKKAVAKSSKKKKSSSPPVQSQLKKTLDNWDEIFSSSPSSQGKFSSSLPPMISLKGSTTNQVTPSYEKELLAFLKKNIILPQKGTTSVKITISATGRILECIILSSSSQENSSFLKKHLPSLTLPCFNSPSAEKTFTIHIAGQ